MPTPAVKRIELRLYDDQWTKFQRLVNGGLLGSNMNAVLHTLIEQKAQELYGAELDAAQAAALATRLSEATARFEEQHGMPLVEYTRQHAEQQAAESARVAQREADRAWLDRFQDTNGAVNMAHFLLTEIIISPEKVAQWDAVSNEKLMTEAAYQSVREAFVDTGFATSTKEVRLACERYRALRPDMFPEKEARR